LKQRTRSASVREAALANGSRGVAAPPPVSSSNRACLEGPRAHHLLDELPSRYFVRADRDGSKGVTVEDQRSPEEGEEDESDS
jgi:hypothetical protein